jgi:outer membrane protein assembly factor BamE (lipoprotein component of BamABCDE complex)
VTATGPAAGRVWRAGAVALSTALLALGLGACTQNIQVRGNMPLEEDLAKVSPGVHSREDVARLLGSPSAVSTFQDSKWYYIGQKITEVAFFAPEVLERKVVVVSFDDTGAVAETKIFSLADSRDIDPVDRKTPTEGRELSFLQQMFGNIGRFSGPGQDER